jgi:autotransporter-associated beta strand protein
MKSATLRKLRQAAVAGVVVFGVSTSFAADVYWNANGGTPDFSGDWNLTLQNWNTAAAGAGSPAAFVAGDVAFFDRNAAYTVNVTEAITAGAVNVQAGTVTFTGTANIAAPTFTIASGATLLTAPDRIFRSGVTALTVDGTLELTAGTSGGRLVNLFGGAGGIVRASAASASGLRITGTGNYAGKLEDSGANRLSLLWNNSTGSPANSTLTLSGDNSAMTGDVLMAVDETILKAASANAISSRAVLRLEGGASANTFVELAAGDFTRVWTAATANSGNGSLSWAGPGGFYATGADRTFSWMTPDTGSGSMLADVVWGTNGLVSGTVALGHENATHKTTWNNNINLGNAARGFLVRNGAAAVDAELSGILSGTAATAGITKSGAGTLVVSGVNTYTGTTTHGVQEQPSGSLVPTNSAALGAGGTLFMAAGGTTGTGALVLNGGITLPHGILQFNGRNGDITAALAKPHIVNAAGENTIASTTINGGGGGTSYILRSEDGKLTINGNFASTAAAGTPRWLVLDGAGNGEMTGTIANGTAIVHVYKAGTGTWTLSGATKTYTGPTNILDGTLVTAGDHTGGDVYTISAGGRLAGTGTIASSVTSVGGAIAPGVTGTPGTLTVGPVTMDAASSLEVEIASAASFDKLVVNGVATIAGNLVTSILPAATPLPTEQVEILSATSVTGTFANTPNAFGLVTFSPGVAGEIETTASSVVLKSFVRAGDVDVNGSVNNQDIAPFVALLTGGNATGAVGFAADVDSNGVVNNQDIAPFVALLTGGRGLADVAGDPDFAPLVALVPEPGTLSLLAAAGVLALRRRRGC